MARDKVLQTTRVNYGLALQDGSPIARAVTQPVLILLRQMAAEIDALRAGAVLVLEGYVDLQAGRYGGETVLLLETPLAAEQLEAPAIVVQAPGDGPIGDVELGGVVWFVARVKTANEIVIGWSSNAPAPSSVKVNCIIGTLEP